MPAVMKTPGVYIVEENAFPSSVVEVATAVPAFIGYTEKADNRGRSLALRPWRITSLSEYHTYFGGAPKPVFRLAEQVAGQPEAETPAPPEAAASEPTAPADDATATAGDEPPADTPAALPDETDAHNVVRTADAPEVAAFSFGGRGFALTPDNAEYLLYYSMQLFFQNSGGPCFVVSVGTYGEAIERPKLESGIDLLIKEQEPTMVLIPEVVRLANENDCIGVQQAMLAHCGEKMKNRFAILDVYNGFRDRQDPAGDCIDSFRSKLGVNFLDYAAAYYPWLNTTVVPATELGFENISEPTRPLLQSLLREELALPPDGQLPEGRARQQAEAINDITKDWTLPTVDGATPPTPAQIALDKGLLNKILKAMSH